MLTPMFHPRLIPAHAGKTLSSSICGHPTRAHPRSRGENEATIDPMVRTEGSSPLTRGKRECSGCHQGQPGLIPAHAGKTPRSTVLVSSSPAHPRSRGENPSTRTAGTTLSGSSPLTRGKRWVAFRARPTLRLIPAHAGKTTWYLVPLFGTAAHPRSRGENQTLARLTRAWRGSSPLTRGKPCRRVRSDTDWGLIPAHAGKTVRDRACKHHGPAHPRSRGENAARGDKIAGAFGSSPLTRGKPSSSASASARAGLIPAHAGKTPPTPARSRHGWAHPRSRGENGSIPSSSEL